jgi:hypothetical protein
MKIVLPIDTGLLNYIALPDPNEVKWRSKGRTCEAIHNRYNMNGTDAF